MLAAIVGASALLALGIVRLRLEEGNLLLSRQARPEPFLRFRYRDSWLLLALIIVAGWAVSTALDRSGWVNGSDIVVPAIFLSTCLGWVLVASGMSGRWYLCASVLATAMFLLVYTPPLATHRLMTLSPDALTQYAFGLSVSSDQLERGGLVALVVVSALWTAWWAFRRGHGLAALLPTGAIIAVEILNDTVHPALIFLTVLWLVAAATILLRLNFVGLKDRWRSRRVPRASDTGWNFGEVGAEAIVMIVLVAFILPPLSNVDVSSVLVPGSTHTLDFHPFGIGAGGGNGGSGSQQVGYSETVRPGASLDAKPSLVMTVSGNVDPLYPFFTGVALGQWDGTKWTQLTSSPDLTVRTGARVAAKHSIPRTDLPSDPKLTHKVQTIFTFEVPSTELDNAVFSAGAPLSVDSQATLVRGIVAPDTGLFQTVDKVQLAGNLHPAYTVTVTESVPSADVASLEAASTTYPLWVEPYRTLYWGPITASTAGDQQIADLAANITAGASNPYDKAKAIESWFLAKGRFKYTLKVHPAPRGVRQLDYFLFQTRTGYCQDFATAMAVMLRTLGIPSRVLSGFGQGFFDEKTHQTVISTTDAHTWVEAYFPGYGWIPFEPTPDQVNFPITRPATAAAATVSTPPVGTVTSRTPNQRLGDLSQDGGTAPAPTFSDVGKQLALAAAVLILLLVIAGLLVLRWLMAPAEIPQIWRRLLFLSDRLRVPRRPGDTPTEFGARLAAAVPELEPELRSLAGLYTRARFRRGGLSGVERIEVRRSWVRVRGRYAGLVVRALRRPPSGDGFTRSAGGSARSRGRGARR